MTRPLEEGQLGLRGTIPPPVPGAGMPRTEAKSSGIDGESGVGCTPTYRGSVAARCCSRSWASEDRRTPSELCRVLRRVCRRGMRPACRWKKRDFGHHGKSLRPLTALPFPSRCNQSFPRKGSGRLTCTKLIVAFLFSCSFFRRDPEEDGNPPALFFLQGRNGRTPPLRELTFAPGWR